MKAFTLSMLALIAVTVMGTPIPAPGTDMIIERKLVEREADTRAASWSKREAEAEAEPGYIRHTKREPEAEAEPGYIRHTKREPEAGRCGITLCRV